MTEVNRRGERERRARTYIYRFFGIGLLDHTDGCICNEDEKNYKGLDECAEKGTTFLCFYEGENEGDESRREQNEDKLIFELLKYQLP